jgi:hypothetical protein
MMSRFASRRQPVDGGPCEGPGARPDRRRRARNALAVATLCGISLLAVFTQVPAASGPTADKPIENGAPKADGVDNPWAGEAGGGIAPPYEISPRDCVSVSANRGRLCLLVARPNQYGYTIDEKMSWLGAIVELYLHCRLSLLDAADVMTLGDLWALLPQQRDFTQRIKKSEYARAAGRLGATNVIYSEYEPADSAVLHVHLAPVAGGGDETRFSIAIDETAIGESLERAAREIAQAIDAPFPVLSGTALLGNDIDAARQLGGCIVREAGPADAALEEAAICAAELGESGSMNVALYAAARLFEAAGRYDMALAQMEAFGERLGGAYPKLHVFSARYARKSGDLRLALTLIDRAARRRRLKAPTLYERARINEKFGSLPKARSNYRELIAMGEGGPAVHYRLALLAARRGDLDQAWRESVAAAKSSGRAASAVLVQIGDELAAGGYEPQAIAVYRRALDSAPFDQLALRKLGNFQEKQNMPEAAAATYARLFDIDQNRNGVYMIKAAELWEARGMSEKAAGAYERLVAAGRAEPDVRVRLAKHELDAGNCAKVYSLLEGIGHPWSSRPAVVDMLDQCAQQARRGRDGMRVALAHDKRMRTHKILRGGIAAGTATLAAGCFIGGLVVNGLLGRQYENEYVSATTTSEASRLHEELAGKQRARAALYAAAALSAAGFGVNIAIPSRY